MSGPTKGMVAGQSIKTGDLTRAYEDGHKRIFGEPDPDAPRGVRFAWDPASKRLVPASMLAASKALDAPVLAGRFYENTMSPIDGTDIGSRRKHREHMKRHGVTTADDFGKEWGRAEKERELIRNGGFDAQGRREDVRRAWDKVFTP